MSDTNKVEQDRAALAAVEGKPFFAKLGTYTKLSGPGWLQSAITLGGGSLGGPRRQGVEHRAGGARQTGAAAEQEW